MGALVERIIAARDRLRPARCHADDDVSNAAVEASEVLAEAANALDNYAKTAALIEKIDNRVVGVLMWLDERARNSASYGSHADAYEIAARRLREAMHDGAAIDHPKKTSSASEPNFSDVADDGPTAA